MNTLKDLCQDSGGTFETQQLFKIYFHVNHNQTLTKCNFCVESFLNKGKCTTTQESNLHLPGQHQESPGTRTHI